MAANPIFKAVQPILPVNDIRLSLSYYIDKLGFTLAFIDSSEKPMYAGIRRDAIEIHLQWHQEENWKQMNASSLRFKIEYIDALFSEYKAQDVFHEQTRLRKTDWGTEEFAFYDPNMNGLTFYRDL